MNITGKTFIIRISFAVITLLMVSCVGKTTGKEEVSENIVSTDPVIGNETLLLLEDLKANGDWVNSKDFPALIKASIVYENLDQNQLIVDLRNPASFDMGHVRGAINKQFGELPAWFETGIRPFEYERIILISDDGQLSSYATSLLRLMGYGNVFSMRWGMSSWNQATAENGWLSGVSSRYESDLETSINESGQSGVMPELTTNGSNGEEIGKARFSELFNESPDDFLIEATEVFSNPEDYYTINYDRRDKYEDGHIPGAVRYKPGSTLGFTDVLATIDSSKPVVIYCGTGHNSAFVTAYLRLFGYDARTLKFGNNGFMYDKMKRDRDILSWLPFSMEDINDFEIVK